MPQPINGRAAVAEALKRGLISPEKAADLGYGSVGQMARTGQLAPGGAANQNSKTDAERLDKYRAESELAGYVSHNADRFVELNERQATGGWRGVGLPFLGTLADAEAWIDPEAAQMKGITAKVGRKLRTPGEGSTSDMETKLNLTAFPNNTAPGPSNQELAKDWSYEKQYRQAMHAYADAWFAKYGTLNGMGPRFNAWWESYDKRVDRPQRRPASAPRGPAGDPLASAPRKAAPAKSTYKILGEE